MTNIRVGCATLVINNNMVLLGVRGKQPGYGALVIPGGGVDLYEEMTTAAKREIKEEAGIEITNLKQIGAYQVIDKSIENHRVIIFWQAEYKCGELTPSSDLLTAKFYSKEELVTEAKNGTLNGVSLQVLKDTGWL